jgi:DNA-directed RNA polymerase III subunit RPC3
MTLQKGSPYEVFCRLLRDGLIRSVTKYDINPEWDIRHEAECIVELNGLPERVTSAKQGTALRQLEIDKILREWRDQADALALTPRTASKKRARSQEPEPANSRKKRKTLEKPSKDVSEDSLNEANGLPLPNGSALPAPGTYEVPSFLLKSNIAVRENHDKFRVIMRNRRLHRLASKVLGTELGCLYDIVLWLVELRTTRCYDPLEINSNNEEPDKLTMQESPTVTLQQIQQEIVRRPRPEFDEIFGSKPNGDISQSINGVNGHTSGDDISSDSEEDGPVQKRRQLSKQVDPSPSGHLNSRLKKIESYLEILCASPERFLRRRGAGYVVPYGRLTPLLMEETLYDHIASHPSLGTQCARIVRILAWVGNCDEKMVSDRAMIALAEARQFLTRLWNFGLIDVYPVARDNQRTASRSIYIYRFDFTAVRVKIIGDCYKSMFNLLRTLQEAKRKAHFVLEKAERSDVKGNEDKYLTAGEQEALRRVRKKEDRILMHIDALDDLVGALRDWWPMNLHVPTLREEFGLKRSPTTNEVVRRDTQDNDEDEEDGEEILPGRASEPPAPTSETERE